MTPDMIDGLSIKGSIDYDFKTPTKVSIKRTNNDGFSYLVPIQDGSDLLVFKVT